jgi:hypothetical protein
MLPGGERVRGHAAVATLFLLAASSGLLALAGCASSAGPQARGTLDRSMAAMAKVRTLKEAGSNELTSDISSDDQVGVSSTSQMDVSDPDLPASHTILKNGQTTIDTWTSGGYIYVQKANGKWTKSRAKGSTDTGPAYLAQMARGGPTWALKTTAAATSSRSTSSLPRSRTSIL